MLSPLDLLDIEDTDDLERLNEASSKFSSIYANLDDSYDCRYEYSPTVPSPGPDKVESFKERSYTLSSSGSLVSADSLAKHKNQINWVNVDDYIRNWSILSKNDQGLVRMLVLSDTVTNANRYGVKKRNLESHLLLSIGADMTNIINNGRDAVLTNLMHPVTRRYSSACVESRVVDPKTCRKAYCSFSKTYEPEKLLSSGFIAYQGVVSSDSGLSKISSEEDKERVVLFFKENRDEFSRLSNKKGVLPAYIYSNEVSVDSILEEKFKPHTHTLFFLEKEASIEDSDSKALEIENLFNSRFSDRKLSLHTIERKGVEVPSSIRKNDELATVLGYFYRAYSLADQYSREVSETNIEELNHKTVEVYRKLLWLFKTSENGNTVRHVNHSRIPVKNKSFDRDTLLQKKRKSSTIKKRATISDLKKNPRSMNKKTEIIKSAIFGMKRRQAARNADPYGVQQEMADMKARGMNPQQINQEFENRHLQREEERKTFDRDMSNMQAQRNNPIYSMSPQGRNAALGRSVDQQLLQEKVDAQNQQVQNIQKERALAQQMRTPDGPEKERAFAQQMHTQDGSDKPKGPAAYNPTFARTVDRNMGVSNEQIGRQQPQSQQQVAQAPASPQQGAQNPYIQAQQSAMQQHPELSQAGSPMNKAFLDLVNQNGGSAALQKDPSLVARYAQQAQQQLAQNKAPAAPVQNTQTQVAKAPTAPQPGSSRFIGPTVPQASDENFIGPLPGDGDEWNDMAQYKIKALADKHPSNANAQANNTSAKASPQQPAPVQPSNNQSQNPLLSGPATSKSFSGNVSLGLGGASQPPKAPTPGQPVAATNTGAAPTPTKQGSMLSEFKATNLEKKAEQDYLQHLREELFKMADLIYSKEQVEEFTSSREAFEKAAMDEASRVWEGIANEMRKEGASEDFVDGFVKEAAGRFAPISKALSNAGKAIASGAGKAWNLTTRAGNAMLPLAKRFGSSFRFSPSQALSGGATGLIGGSLLGGPLGAGIGALGGAALGGLGTGGATALGLGGGYLAGRSAGIFGPQEKKLDEFGAPRDRHRVLPFMKNKYTGAAGGAMLAHLMANESGLTGPMAWLLPILGGIAGHRFFPQMMNKWKDPMGFGANSVGSGAAMINQQTPLTGAPGAMS